MPAIARYDVGALNNTLARCSAIAASSVQTTGELIIATVEGRKVSFDVAVKDELEEVGAGTHTRFVVDKAKTFERLKAKAARLAARSG